MSLAIAVDRLESAARLGSRATIAMVSAPAPVLDAASIAAALGADLRTLWRGASGELLAGAGSVARVSAQGPDRFVWARRRAGELFARIAGEAQLLGGFAFASGPRSPQWRGFEDAGFELARLLYRRVGAAATLAVAVANPLDPRSRAAGIAALERGLERLAHPPPATVRSASAVVAGDPRSTRRYVDGVGRARDAIRAGRLRKVVIARRADAEIAASLPALLGALDGAYPSCTLLVRASSSPGAGVLVAASPERLVQVGGASVVTEALAGTAPRGEADSLRSSTKLQHEHQLTADHIAAALAAGGCRRVEVGDQRLRPLADLVHLETPITAARPAGSHLFDLAAALHPTPAVAGIPTDRACRFIEATEAMDRGWYAGPVGWVDRRGDGELAVALRAGLVTGQNIALYAGAGIVAASDPAAELAETELKLRALGRRLAGGRR